MFFEYLEHGTAPTFGASPWGPLEPIPDLLGEPVTLSARYLVDRSRDVDTFGPRRVRGGGQHPAGELVITRRQGHLEVLAGPTVELGRAARAGPTAAGQPLVINLEESVCREPVEVVGGGTSQEANGKGRLIAYPLCAVCLNEPRAGERAMEKILEQAAAGNFPSVEPLPGLNDRGDREP